MKSDLQKSDRRAARVRAKLRTSGRPRLSVFRSNKNISAQIIDDVKGVTLVSASSLDEDGKKAGKGANKDGASAVGKLIAQRALEKGLKDVVFDRGGYIYHGRVKALAEAAREGGLNF
ncbi:MAG TPA: 50S ribosomal protein L18 [Caulobacterales bacterium]|jgi:large subunit ribosomal protein L18|nr:50S ribosomal protein L18 [Caulobacterales bacterium]